jgi:antitoxin component YwqK of YwqJK toxin-antitoxin module
MTAIKTITTLKFDYMQAGAGENFENIKPLKSAYAEYDQEGHVLMEISFNSHEKIEQKCINKYNEQGKLIEEHLFNEDGELDEKKTYEYDEKGNVVKELLYYVDGSFDTTIFIYDVNGHLIEKTTIDPDNEIESKKVLTYDNANLLSEVTTDAEGSVLSEVHIKYDEKGNETEIERYNSEDDKTTRTEFIYNEEGKKSEAHTYTNGKHVSKQVYESDEKDQLIKIEEEELFSKSVTTLEYDDHGNMILQLEVDENGELNNRIIRKFNDSNKLAEVNVTIDRHGRGLNQNYLIQYTYEYFG